MMPENGKIATKKPLLCTDRINVQAGSNSKATTRHGFVVDSVHMLRKTRTGEKGSKKVNIM